MNDLSTRSSDSVQSKIYLCSNCQRVPVMRILYMVPLRVFVTCEYCSKTVFIPVKKMINYYNTKKQPKNKSFIFASPENLKDDSKCVNHPQKNGAHFCCKCNKTLCINCFHKDHSRHPSLNFLRQGLKIQLNKCDELLENFSLAKELVENYSARLQQNIIQVTEKNPNCNSELSLVKKRYDKNVKENRRFLMFIDFLVNLYDCSNNNIHAVFNILNNCKFNISKFVIPLSMTLLSNIQHHSKVNESNYIFQRNSSSISFCHCIKELKECGEINSFLIFDDCKKIAVATLFSEIDTYDLKTGRMELCLKGHRNRVNYLAPYGKSKILSCSCDETIKIWSIKEGSAECEATIQSTFGKIVKAELHGDSIISFTDNAIITWENKFPYTCHSPINISKNEKIKTFLVLKDNTLVTLSSNELKKMYILEFYEIKSFTKKGTTSISQSPKANLPENANNLILEGDDDKLYLGEVGKVFIISTSSYQVISQIQINSIKEINCLGWLNDDSIMVCSPLSMVSLNANTLEIEGEKDFPHSNFVSCMKKIANGIFATSSYDCTLKIWEY